MYSTAEKTSKKTSSNKTSKKTSSSQAKEEGSKDDDQVTAVGAKDTSMFLFRALGKILYCKSE